MFYSMVNKMYSEIIGKTKNQRQMTVNIGRG